MPEDDGRDLDALARDTPAASSPPTHAMAETKVLLHYFPAGAGPGTFIHAVYEHLDFTQAEPEVIRVVAEQQLARQRLQKPVDLDVLARGIADTLRTPLDARGELRLCRVGTRDRRNEVELTLRTALAARRLSPRALADALERTSALPAWPSYYARLAALPRLSPAEHVKGFMDLVFRCDGRYYVADYKSNLLGSYASDYAQAPVLAAMAEHHYFLQAYLYALALHRHLQQKLAGYDYAQQFGGVAYLFVRGMSEAHPPGTGVWLDRPSLATLDALADALGAAEGAA
jgi:exodeoxyribonuclease V beta subunit